jgi:hypothetical protein
VEILARIQRLVLQDKVLFTAKAQAEMDLDGLTDDDVVEALLNAEDIDKVVRSKSRWRRKSRDRLYIIKSATFDGTAIYTKGAIRKEEGYEVFYVLISAKRLE